MGWCGHDGLVFDEGQPTKTHLPASAAVGAFDPGDDGDAELLAGDFSAAG
jgi:hypothetical protein